MRTPLTYIVLFCFCMIITSCADKKARRPVTVKTSTFLKESAAKNKALLEQEESLIDAIITKDTLNNYIDSQHGFKYYYSHQNPDADYTAQFGDIVSYTYCVTDLNGNMIYDKTQENLTYRVGKEELFFGLRSALKILKENESGVFFFPSEIAFGYHGDNDKIGHNQPIIAEIELVNIKKSESIKP